MGPADEPRDDMCGYVVQTVSDPRGYDTDDRCRPAVYPRGLAYRWGDGYRRDAVGRGVLAQWLGVSVQFAARDAEPWVPRTSRGVTVVVGYLTRRARH